MKNFSYTKTPELVNKLETIEDLRKNILLTPITLKKEIEIKFKCTLQNIALLYLLEVGQKIEIGALEEIARSGSSENSSKEKGWIYRSKNILGDIYFEWTGLNSPVSSSSVDKYHQNLILSRSGLSTTNSTQLQQLLQYAQASVDHPILQAGLVHGMIATEQVYSRDSYSMGFITQIVFLYKNGYGIRGMSSLGNYLIDNLDSYKNLISQAQSDANMTPWLGFIVDGTIESLSYTYKLITTNHDKGEKKNINLNDRQKQILSYLSIPNTKISNKTVQILYKVSPITASRDLTKLVELGAILPLGKGRSTYYTLV